MLIGNKRKELFDFGGNFVYSKYNGSIYQMLCTVYPQQEWSLEKFHEKVGNIKEQMEILGKKWEIKEMNDWYKISKKVKFGSIFANINKGFGVKNNACRSVN